MRVYLAAAMTNGARDLGAIRALLASIEGEGHEVPTRHVADPRGREVEGEATDAEVAQRDLAWVMSCDALVAEVSTPSHGVGVEVATALQHGIPVLLLHRRDAVVSRLMLGLTGVESAAYSDPDAIAPAVRA
ncbi:MAG TPA: nucleoside 2-deoxyribosyltransferase, partial [Thermoanaerobaculaceae bacterium]|nr:nucleoside 2-deoxyribosyltransferase [Thermoanaerobaculaceae bacterium]